ncbi:MAG TPA: dimethylsulfonioproprionate lyase family protein [bacterium]|nr:dimethylsulfonioproprionate lyase family protein [bacterium]
MIHRLQIADVAAREFPAGRATRVFAGISGLPAKRFVVGESTIFPRGAVPAHHHSNEEIYVILQGEGQMTVGDETFPVSAGSAVYLPPNIPHELHNTGEGNLVTIFVYAPATVVSHWAEEANEGRKGS